MTVAMRQDANSSLHGDGSVCDPPIKPIPLPLLAPLLFIGILTHQLIDSPRNCVDRLTFPVRLNPVSGCATKCSDGMLLLDVPCVEADGTVA